MERVIPNPKARLLDQVREVMRLKHYSLRTEQTYIQWIKRFIFFHQKRHPREMGAPEVKAFLTDLAVRHRVAASTQNQGLNALVFLYRQLFFTCHFYASDSTGFSPRSHSAKRDGRFSNAQERDVKRLGVPRAGRPSLVGTVDSSFGCALRF